MDDFKARTIYHQGMNAFYEHEGKYENHFKIGSEEFDLFERGWTQALKRHRGTLPGESGKNSSHQLRGSSLAEKYQNMRDWSSKEDD